MFFLKGNCHPIKKKVQAGWVGGKKIIIKNPKASKLWKAKNMQLAFMATVKLEAAVCPASHSLQIKCYIISRAKI